LSSIFRNIGYSYLKRLNGSKIHNLFIIYLLEASTGKSYNYYINDVTDLEILLVLVTRLLRRDLSRLVNGIEPVEPWDEG
jgi:hypothetical protein